MNQGNREVGLWVKESQFRRSPRRMLPAEIDDFVCFASGLGAHNIEAMPSQPLNDLANNERYTTRLTVAYAGIICNH